MTRLRWLGLPVAVCALLIWAGYGTLPAAAESAGLHRLATPPLPPTSGPLPITATAPASATAPITAPAVYVVQPGDTLSGIAHAHATTVDALRAANGLRSVDHLDVGQMLQIPSPSGELPPPATRPAVGDGSVPTQTAKLAPQGTITDRMTLLAQQADVRSPYYGTTWLTYYGRPNVPPMGILGEYSITALIPLLRAEAQAYDRANGDGLTVTPAFHLVYGMATKAPGDDDSHLAFLDDDEVISYIVAAQDQGWQVILDVQIGALTPSAAITRALKFLHYPNVHLAIDPEFAMAHPDQAWPGDPIGFVTADQVNHVQAIVNAYLQILDLPRPRLLLVHQFQSNMIVAADKLDTQTYPHVALTVSVDGWGGPWAKIDKYNSMVTPGSPYTAFKLFYRWDEPLLLPEEALGMEFYGDSDWSIEVTPNLIIYQ